VRDPNADRLEPGDILIAEFTDPGWITVFVNAAGLAVERGSLLSHSAIVARELQIPAVVGVANLLAWVKDGDEA
jgi:pyruvate,water dikinase